MINDRTNLNSSVMYQFGKVGNTNIDYQNANSPDPTYFREIAQLYTSLLNVTMNSQVLLYPILKTPKSRLEFWHIHK
jgi:hypothetical protein